VTSTDRKITHQWVPQNDDEHFDHVEVTSHERWKESELSGDEWRFSFRTTFYSHGVKLLTRGGASIEDCLISAAHWFRHPRTMNEDAETSAAWTVARADVEERCAQPRCAEFWTVLYHPIKKYRKDGTADGLHWDDRTKEKPTLGWLAVRGFCDRHRHRGDCDLEDADDNYELILERIPPGWAE
jgi:hypothetical protein